jgi:hypothetical protein
VLYFSTKKLFLSSRKYDPGWVKIRIRIPDPGSGSATLVLTCGEHVEEYVEWDGDPEVAEDLHPAQDSLLLLHVRVLHPPVKELQPYII